MSYPHQAYSKATRLIPLSWFNSVGLVALEGQPRLPAFIHFLTVGVGAQAHPYDTLLTVLPLGQQRLVA